MAAITAAQKAIPLAVALRVLRLPPARFHRWRNLGDNCTFDDRPSCPHSTPDQFTAQEVATIGGMVQDASFRHMSLRDLALHAQRISRVFAAVSNWARLVRERGWLRPSRGPLLELYGRSLASAPRNAAGSICPCLTPSRPCRSSSPSMWSSTTP